MNFLMVVLYVLVLKDLKLQKLFLNQIELMSIHLECMNNSSKPFKVLIWISEVIFTITLFFLVEVVCTQVYQVDLKRKFVHCISKEY
mmetsp:Transcript_1775/g.4863  ORF Transcript_1775/g.4863 Transcript_1775/m.4863 type:complete len:87 (+) Transcript_1775:741-1001(+)